MTSTSTVHHGHRGIVMSERAQAMVEFALILPILLVLILGVFTVGLALLMSQQLTHAAQQGATAGANELAVPQRCTTAIATAETVYSGILDASACTQPGNVVELTLTDTVPAVSPFGPWVLNVTAKAVAP
jgi:Flp pilus assembly protein TadG